jgi:hypothetical protein
MGIIARNYSLRRVAPLSSSSLCFLSQFCMAQELEMVVGMVWYGMASVSIIIDMDLDMVVGIGGRSRCGLRDGSGWIGERNMSHRVHPPWHPDPGIIFQYNRSLLHQDRQKCWSVMSNASERSPVANRQRRTSRLLARTFYHDVWDPPGNKTISPGWSRPRSLLRV